MAAFAGMFDLEGRREIDRERLRRMGAAMAPRADGQTRMTLEPGIGVLFKAGRSGPSDGVGLQRTSRGSTFCSDGRPLPAVSPAGALAAQGRPAQNLPDELLLAEFVDLRAADALCDLSGGFALSAYSEREESLLLARSRFGEKPLFFAVSRDGLLLFASEHRAIIASGLVHAVLDEARLTEALFYGYLPSPGTPFANVADLPPGHALVARRGRPLPAPRGWALSATSPGDAPAGEEAGDALSVSLARAVRRQAAAGCRLILLSDGAGAPALETACLPLGSAAAPVEPQRWQGSAESIAQPIVQAFGEPFHDPAALHAAACLGANDLTGQAVLIDDGAEELFGAHPRYAAIKPAAAAALPAYRFRVHSRRSALLPRGMVRRLAAAPLRDAAPEETIERLAASLSLEPTSACIEADRRARLPGRTIKMSDRLSAAAGADLRRPFLDEDMQFLGAALLHGGPARPAEALRAAAGEAHRPGRQAGLNLPADSLAETVLRRLHWRDSGLFDVDACEKIARRRGGGGERRQALWSLLVTDLFLESL